MAYASRTKNLPLMGVPSESFAVNCCDTEKQVGCWNVGCVGTLDTLVVGPGLTTQAPSSKRIPPPCYRFLVVFHRSLASGRTVEHQCLFPGAPAGLGGFGFRGSRRFIDGHGPLRAKRWLTRAPCLFPIRCLVCLDTNTPDMCALGTHPAFLPVSVLLGYVRRLKNDRASSC